MCGVKGDRDVVEILGLAALAVKAVSFPHARKLPLPRLHGVRTRVVHGGVHHEEATAREHIEFSGISQSLY